MAFPSSTFCWIYDSGNFASCFNCCRSDPSFGEKVKIGLKFGATATTSKTVSYTVTKSLASDELGQVIVNFEDKILKSKKNLSTGRDWKPDYTDKYRTGWYQLALSPLKYN